MVNLQFEPKTMSTTQSPVKAQQQQASQFLYSEKDLKALPDEEIRLLYRTHYKGTIIYFAKTYANCSRNTLGKFLNNTASQKARKGIINFLCKLEPANNTIAEPTTAAVCPILEDFFPSDNMDTKQVAPSEPKKQPQFAQSTTVNTIVLLQHYYTMMDTGISITPSIYHWLVYGIGC